MSEIKMENLKVTIELNSPVILDRNTTIDGILLAAYYRLLKAKTGEDIPFDKHHERVNFIEKKNGVFSGSIWYIDKNEDVEFDVETIISKPEYEKIYDRFYIKKGVIKKTMDVKFKQYLKSEEIMLVRKIYFYIKADKKRVQALLDFTHSIGKNQRVGFGTVKDFKIEIIDDDKGFQLNESTPSKPLPVNNFDIKSKKICLMRRMTPYWLQEDLEPCYMPTTALYEITDNSFKKRVFKTSDTSYIHNCEFLYKHKNNSNISFNNKAMTSKGYTSFFYANSPSEKCDENNKNEDLKCTILDEVKPIGIKYSIKEGMNHWRKNFIDLQYFKNNDFISLEALWSIENIAYLSSLYVDEKNWIYVMGKNCDESKNGLHLFLKNPKKLQPPFTLLLRKSDKNQHVSFKGKVSISNAYFVFQKGDNQFYIDNELMQEAISDIEKYSEIGIDRKLLCGVLKDAASTHYSVFGKWNTLENRKIISDFRKKYNKDIRVVLGQINLNK